MVEEYSPMKRGLKALIDSWLHWGRKVEEYSPMKRGLKDNIQGIEMDHRELLKSIPR